MAVSLKGVALSHIPGTFKFNWIVLFLQKALNALVLSNEFRSQLVVEVVQLSSCSVFLGWPHVVSPVCSSRLPESSYFTLMPCFWSNITIHPMNTRQRSNVEICVVLVKILGKTVPNVSNGVVRIAIACGRRASGVI